MYHPKSKEDMKRLIMNELAGAAFNQKLSPETMTTEKHQKDGVAYAYYNIKTEPFMHKKPFGDTEEEVIVRARVLMIAKKVDGKPCLYFVIAREMIRSNFSSSGKFFSQLEELLGKTEF